MLENYEKQRRLEEERRLAKKEKARANLRQVNRQKPGLAKNAVSDLKSLAKNLTPLGFFAAFAGVNILTDWMYFLALLAAIFKDLTDWILVGPLFFLAIIVGFLVSIFIAFMMILGSIFADGKGRLYHKAIRSYLILLAGTTAEMLFGVNFIPIETMTVLVIWYLALCARKQVKESSKKERLAYAQ